MKNKEIFINNGDKKVSYTYLSTTYPQIVDKTFVKSTETVLLFFRIDGIIVLQYNFSVTVHCIFMKEQ